MQSLRRLSRAGASRTWLNCTLECHPQRDDTECCISVCEQTKEKTSSSVVVEPNIGYLFISPHQKLPYIKQARRDQSYTVTVHSAHGCIALSTVFTVNAPSVWNSLWYICRSDDSVSGFRRILYKLNCLIAFRANVKQSAECGLIRQYRHTPLDAIEISID